MAGFRYVLEREDGSPVDPLLFVTALPPGMWKPGQTFLLGSPLEVGEGREGAVLRMALDPAAVIEQAPSPAMVRLPWRQKINLLREGLVAGADAFAWGE